MANTSPCRCPRRALERGDAHVYEVATGRELKDDLVPAVNTGTAGGSLAWTADGFFYTRHPLEGERSKEDLGFFQQVYFHKLGTPTRSDAYALGKVFLRIAENFVSTSSDGQWAADLVQKGDGGEYELFLHPPDGGWTKVADYEDRIVQVRFGRDGALYLLSRKGAPKGQVLRLPLVPGKLVLAEATVVVSEGQGAIQEVTPTKSRLYVTEQLGGPSHVRRFDLAGHALGDLPTPPVTSLSGVAPVGDEDDVVVYTSGYLSPVGNLPCSAQWTGSSRPRLRGENPGGLDPLRGGARRMPVEGWHAGARTSCARKAWRSMAATRFC